MIIGIICTIVLVLPFLIHDLATWFINKKHLNRQSRPNKNYRGRR